MSVGCWPDYIRRTGESVLRPHRCQLQCVREWITTPCSGCEPAVQLNHTSGLLGGWLAPLMVIVKYFYCIGHMIRFIKSIMMVMAAFCSLGLAVLFCLMLYQYLAGGAG